MTLVWRVVRFVRNAAPLISEVDKIAKRKGIWALTHGGQHNRVIELD